MSEHCPEFFPDTSGNGNEEVRLRGVMLGGHTGRCEKNFCYDEEGFRVFDGDETGRMLALDIRGVCKRTGAAVTGTCFNKYCGKGPGIDCPQKR